MDPLSRSQVGSGDPVGRLTPARMLIAVLAMAVILAMPKRVLTVMASGW
jgi:hypothetical protein